MHNPCLQSHFTDREGSRDGWNLLLARGKAVARTNSEDKSVWMQEVFRANLAAAIAASRVTASIEARKRQRGSDYESDDEVHELPGKKRVAKASSPEGQAHEEGSQQQPICLDSDSE